jgi:shikimate 5-dehydrogenase
VNLGLGDALLDDIVSAKGHTKIIGNYFDDNPNTGGWRGEHRMSLVVQAQDLGCDLVRISQPALSEADNLEAQQFLKTVRESMGSQIPVIAYNTGRLGRQSRVLNPILSPVVSTLRTTSISSQQLDEGILTVQEAQNALYSSFTLEPLRFGIFGQGVYSSLSPAMQSAAFRYSSMPHTYQAFDSSSLQNLALFVKSANFGGASITSPFKQEIIPLIDILSPDAQAIGAVNTVIPLRSVGDKALLDRTSRGPVLALYGENTDWIGVHTMVRRNLSPVNAVKPRTCGLVLGAGGMAHATVYGLIRLGVQNIWIWSRTLTHAKSLAARYNGKRYSVPSPDLVATHALQGRREDEYFGPANVRVVETLGDDWEASASLPTIIVSCIPSPQIEISSSWLSSKTGGVVIEASPSLFYIHTYLFLIA